MEYTQLQDLPLKGCLCVFSSMSTGQHGVNTAKGPSGPPGKPGPKGAQRNSTSLILYKNVKFNNTINKYIIHKL